MTDRFERYEKECERIRKNNAVLLDRFSHWLKEKKLSKSTIDTHRMNIDFFINEYLLYEDALEPDDGVDEIGSFLGGWFIRKAMWASAATIRSSAGSFKKFYRFMLENGRIEQEELDEMERRIKEEMPEWIETLSRYDDPDIEDSDEIWGQ
jgi:site-specific recombinase XerD